MTQIKQIAGRAGRFGLHTPKAEATTSVLSEDEEPVPVIAPGGIVTTLHAHDLPLLTKLLPQPLPPISRATLDPPMEGVSALADLLPAETTYRQLLEHFAALARTPPNIVVSNTSQKNPVADLLEPFKSQLGLSEMTLFCFSPLSARNEQATSVFKMFLRTYVDTGAVDLVRALHDSGLLTVLEKVENTLREAPKPVIGAKQPTVLVTSLPMLETLHKSLVLYIWLSFRLEISFPERTLASEIKERTEKALEECLERLPGLKRKRKTPRHEPELDIGSREDDKLADAVKWQTGDQVKAEINKRRRSSMVSMPVESGR